MMSLMWSCLRASSYKIHSLNPLMMSMIPFQRNITTTGMLMAEPPKKKKKIDIVIVKMRVERKVKKLEKAIRKLKKTPKQLKPIEEYVLPPAILKAIDVRTRVAEESDPDIFKLSKVWRAYRTEEGIREKQSLMKVLSSQNKALQILKQESPMLYSKAIDIDPNLLPLDDTNIVTETPPNPDYTPPDGTRTDISKIWSM